MSAPPTGPRSWFLSPWVKWSWLLLLVVIVAYSLSFQWRVLPTTAGGYWSRGQRDFLNEDFESAVANLSKSIERGGKDAEAFVYRGVAYSQLGDHAKALSDVETALTLRPDYARAHAAFGDVKAAMWDAPAAFEAYSRALELDPNYTRCAVERGMLAYDAGRWRDAETDFRRLGRSRMGTNEPLTPLLIWLARARAGDAAGASEELRGVMKAGQIRGDRFWAAAQFLTGEITEPTYLASLDGLDDEDPDRLKTEALFLAGSKRLALGDRAGAVALIRDAFTNSPTGWYARDRARVELEATLVGLHPKWIEGENAELEVIAVTPGGPAEAAGIRPGSILESIDGVPATQESFVDFLAEGEPGSTAEVQVRSAEEARSTVSLTLTLGSSEPTK